MTPPAKVSDDQATFGEDARFEISCNRFNTLIAEYEENDEASWHLLESRQQEIMNFHVSNEKKVQAFDRVLWELSRIHPRSNTAYEKALAKKISLMSRKQQEDLLRSAQIAYMHSDNVDFALYGKIMFDIYQKLNANNKKNFPLRFEEVKNIYRKKQLKDENKAERDIREERLREIDFYIYEYPTEPQKKLEYIEEAIELMTAKYFGKINSNKHKKNYCLTAADICRQELYDNDTADLYIGRAHMYEGRAFKAFLYTEKGNTPENHLLYQKKFHTKE